jgi:hypothetical protein
MPRFRLRFAALLLGATLLLPTPASAGKYVDTRVSIQPNAPIEIVGCGAYWETTEVSFLYKMVIYYDFVARVAQGVSAVRMHFSYFSPFGESAGGDYATTEGTFSNGVRIAKADTETSEYPVPSRVVCTIDTVKLRDGTVLSGDDLSQPTPEPVQTRRAQPQPAPTPRPQPAPTVVESSWQPATCSVRLASGKTIEIPWENEGCASARKAFAARSHPKTCRAKLADGTEIDIPWNPERCAASQRAGSPKPAGTPAGLPSPRPTPSPGAIPTFPPGVIYQRSAEMVDGHPRECVILEGANRTRAPWASDICAGTRTIWDAYMRRHPSPTPSPAASP